MTSEESPPVGPAALATAHTLTCASCRAVLHGEPTCPSCGDPFRTGSTGASISALVGEMESRLEAAVAGRYELRGLLGHGGMGAVFLAVELRLDRLVAIKVLPPTLAKDEELLSRFEREARTAARLDHPGIVPIYSVEDVDGLHFFVMKFVPGVDLDEAIGVGPIPVDTARRVLIDTARALAHAHARGVIHRDVKPSNIMIDPDGRIVVADFGIAKAAAGNASVTSTGQALGSPQYMSPEQMEARDVDGRSDQYGLGMVGYHMLAGRAPFEGASYGSVLVKQVTEYPVPLAEVRSGLPADLVAILERAIRKDPAERFPDLNAFADALEGRAVEGAVGRGRRPAGGPRVRTVGLVAGAAVVGVAAWAAFAGGDGDAPGGSPLDRLEGLGLDPEVSEFVQGAEDMADELRRQSDSAMRAAGLAGAGDGASVEGPEGGGDAPTGTTSEPTAPAPTGGTTATSAAASSGPEAAAETGLLTVNASPWGYVCLDGVDLGQSTPIFQLEVEPGDHEVLLYREGYTPIVDTVRVNARNTTTRSYTLFEDATGEAASGC